MSTAEATRQFSTVTQELGEKIVSLTLKEAKELSDYLEEVHGIKPAAGGAVMMAAPTGDGGGAAAAAEKTEFDVVLKDAGPKKIETIKVIRQLTSLGLVDAKTMAETAGAKVLSAVSKEAAADAKGKLEAAGAVVVVA